jgi:VPDSG-CTERM motif
MREKANFAGLAIAGTAPAFVGLAGNVQAIPISIHGARLGKIEPFFSDHLGGKTHSIELGNLNKNPSRPTLFPVSGSGAAQNSSSHHNFWPWKSPYHKYGAPPLTSSPTASSPAPTTSVPDGGTTGMMLGGVFCGFVLLRKKLEAWSGFSTVQKSDLRREIYPHPCSGTPVSSHDDK